ncbi:MAG: DnaJ family domain-containing protein [Jiangellaceae bacterium]
MTERKPAGMSFEGWVERRIREARERGEFDDLPGAGKPLPGVTGNYDEMWWVNQVLRREAEELLDGLADVPSEAAVRDRVQDYNARVVDAIRRPQDSPNTLMPRRLDADETASEWARRRAARRSSVSDEPATGVAEVEPGRRRRWWTRLRRQRSA